MPLIPCLAANGVAMCLRSQWGGLRRWRLYGGRGLTVSRAALLTGRHGCGA